VREVDDDLVLALHNTTYEYSLLFKKSRANRVPSHYYVLTKYVNVSLSSLKNKLLNSVKAISGVTYEIEGGYPFTALKITKLDVDAMYSYGSSHPHLDDDMIVDSEPVNNFPIANIPEPTPQTAPPIEVVRVATHNVLRIMEASTYPAELEREAS